MIFLPKHRVLFPQKRMKDGVKACLFELVWNAYCLKYSRLMDRRSGVGRQHDSLAKSVLQNSKLHFVTTSARTSMSEISVCHWNDEMDGYHMISPIQPRQSVVESQQPPRNGAHRQVAPRSVSGNLLTLWEPESGKQLVSSNLRPRQNGKCIPQHILSAKFGTLEYLEQ